MNPDLEAKNKARRQQWAEDKMYQEAANKITDIVNPMMFDPEKLAHCLSRQHRTLQQNLFGAFLQWVVTLAQNYRDGHFDLRNEVTCKTAHIIYEEILKDNLELNGKIHLPYI